VNAGTTMRARSDVRSRAASLIAVTVFVGVAGAVAMASFTAARRADTVYARFRATTDEPAVILFGGPNCPFSKSFPLDEIAGLPQVTSTQPVWNTFANASDQDGNEILYPNEQFDVSIIATDLHAPDSVRPLMLSGRLPRTEDEVLLGWGNGTPRPALGDTIDVSMVKIGSVDAVYSGRSTDDDLLATSLVVVGTAIMPGELDGTSGSLGVIPAFADRYRDKVLGCEAGMFHLQNDLQDTAAFWTGAKRIAPGAFGFDTSTEKTVALRSTSLQAIMLRLFGGLAALAALLVLGQVLIRRTMLAATDAPVLRALGMTRGQLLRAASLPAIAVAAGAVVIALSGAVGLSVFTPLGDIKIFEASPGVFVYLPILVVGAIVIASAVILCVAIPAWRTSKDASSMLGTVEFSGSSHRSKLAALIASMGVPVSAVAGTRLALEPGHGRTSTPVRSAIIGLTLAVTALVAAFGFAASMDGFTSNSTLWGVDFDFATGHPFIGSLFQDEALPLVVDDPGVADATAGNFQEQLGLIGPDGAEPVAMWGTENQKGNQIDLTMLEGRWPRSNQEVAVGRQTARALGVSIGDTVQAQQAGTTKDLTVVGIPVFPDFGFGPGLGQGAGATMDLLRQFYPEATLNLVVAKFTPGADQAATLDRINSGLQTVNQDLEINLRDQNELGVSVLSTQKSRELPLILAVLFGVVAFVSLIHVLVTSVRRRRRDLAILRTIGFRRRQIAATIAWQATTIASIALLVGVPVGFLVGRFAWALFADRLGIVSRPVEAWSSVAIVVPAILVVANLVAIGPAMFARRTQPAQVLRAE
jgi:putative ABC transport system permease protein